MVPNSRGLVWRLVHSFTLKLVLLALVLLSLPLVLYWQFARAEQEQIALIGNAVIQTNHVLAAMLRGVVDFARRRFGGAFCSLFQNLSSVRSASGEFCGAVWAS